MRHPGRHELLTRPSLLLASCAVTAEAPELWESAEATIRAQRGAIDAWLEAGGEAYGFTTLLGHLADNAQSSEPSAAGQGREMRLIRSHLVASTHRWTLGPIATRCIIGAKLFQFSAGASGVSPETFILLRQAWGTVATVRIPLEASYSCGDVVPGAWLMADVLDERAEIRRGDAIATINGSHVSTGLGLFALGVAQAVAVDLIDRLMDVRRVAVDPVRRQRPVSLRGATSSSAGALREALRACSDAIDRRLSGSAANPHFTLLDDGKVHVESSAMFVDFALSDALLGLRNALLLGVHELVVLHQELERVAGSARTLTLQYPKVLHGLSSRMVQRFSSGPPYLRPVDGGSDGLEDVADHSLHLSLDVLQLARSIDALLEVAREHVVRLDLAGTSDRVDGSTETNDERVSIGLLQQSVAVAFRREPLVAPSA